MINLCASFCCFVFGYQLEGLENVVEEASEVRMELAAMGSELLEKMARSPHVVCRLPAVSEQGRQQASGMQAACKRHEAIGLLFLIGATFCVSRKQIPHPQISFFIGRSFLRSIRSSSLLLCAFCVQAQVIDCLFVSSDTIRDKARRTSKIFFLNKAKMRQRAFSTVGGEIMAF